MTTITADEGFVIELQHLLEHLYDPAFVRDSPILELLLSSTNRSAAGLQRLLTEAIQALMPGPDVPVHTRAWRAYHILRWRYVEQTGQVEVAQNLALSRRHLRRQERVAVQALADHLWLRYEIGRRYRATVDDKATPPEPSARRDELQWLGESVPTATVNILTLIEQGLGTVRPLARSQGIEFAVTCNTPLTDVTGQVSVLRQAIIGLLTAALLAASGDTVSVTIDLVESALLIRFESAGAPGDEEAGREVGERVEMASQLVGLVGGSLATDHGESGFTADLILPDVAEHVVLVIDDNADALRLVQRFLAQSPYRFMGARDPERAISLAESVCPRAILLDIMLPGVDGWELLGRLREHPALCHVPVIVCTILPQSRLATTLGAAAFLRKPLRREPLLETLARLAPIASNPVTLTDPDL